MLCPRCGQSNAAQSVRSIYEGGTSQVHTVGTVYGVGEGQGHWGGGVGWTNQYGISQTLLAQRLSPPKKPMGSFGHLAWFIGFGLLTWLFGYVLLVSLLVEGLSIIDPNVWLGIITTVPCAIATLFFPGADHSGFCWSV
jgi:hypothetical protein